MLFCTGSELDWKFKTTNETHACLRRGGVCSWPRGKNLGGTTVHHGMAYHRGNPKDFEKWVAMGNEDWSWQAVIFYLHVEMRIFIVYFLHLYEFVIFCRCFHII